MSSWVEKMAFKESVICIWFDSNPFFKKSIWTH